MAPRAPKKSAKKKKKNPKTQPYKTDRRELDPAHKAIVVSMHREGKSFKKI
jgi:hypothetical protein